MTTINDRIAADLYPDLLAAALEVDSLQPGENVIAMLRRVARELPRHRADRARHLGAHRTNGGRIEVERDE